MDIRNRVNDNGINRLVKNGLVEEIMALNDLDEDEQTTRCQMENAQHIDDEDFCAYIKRIFYVREENTTLSNAEKYMIPFTCHCEQSGYHMLPGDEYAKLKAELENLTQSVETSESDYLIAVYKPFYIERRVDSFYRLQRDLREDNNGRINTSVLNRIENMYKQLKIPMRLINDKNFDQTRQYVETLGSQIQILKSLDDTNTEGERQAAIEGFQTLISDLYRSLYTYSISANRRRAISIEYDRYLNIKNTLRKHEFVKNECPQSDGRYEGELGWYLWDFGFRRMWQTKKPKAK